MAAAGYTNPNPSPNPNLNPDPNPNPNPNPTPNGSKEWTTLIKNIEDPKLTFHKKSVVPCGLP